MYGQLFCLWALSNSLTLLQYEPGSRMILDAVLLAIAKLAREKNPHLSIAIFPEMRITGDPVELEFQGVKKALTGIIDYAVIQYRDIMQNKGELIIRAIQSPIPLVMFLPE